MPPSKKLAKKPKKDKQAKACRICLSAKNDERVLFDVDSDWSRLFDYCFGITVLPNVGPMVLCMKCSKKLKDYSEFKTLALKSDTIWNNVLLAEVKEDPIFDPKIEKTETIDIKDENDAEDFPHSEYLELDFAADEIISHDNFEIDNKEQNIVEDIKIEIPAKSYVKDEEVPCKKSLRKRSIYMEDPKNLKGLSEKEFIKKFFEVLRDTTGRLKTLFECLKCGESFKRRKSLPPHVQKCYESEVLLIKKEAKEKSNIAVEIYECGLCNLNSPEENVTMKHLKQQHCLANDLSCKLCDYTGRDMADVVCHRYEHMVNLNYRGKFRCPVCDKIRLNGLSLQFHYRTIHLGKKAGGWCNICNKHFNGYIYFRNHIRWHKNAKYICDFCGAKFLFRNLIEAHIKEHMNVRNYVCDTCGKSFKRNNALTGHIKSCHTVHKAVPCDHCGKTFKNQHSVKLHMKMVRKGNNFICDVCCKGYPTMSLLKKHMFWHTGERPFSCDTCGGKFKSKGNLNIHMKKHMGIYPFKCDSCEKQFATSTQLKAHSSVHTGIRRVKCIMCEKTFHDKRQMLTHCKAKHESMMSKNDSNDLALGLVQPVAIIAGPLIPTQGSLPV